MANLALERGVDIGARRSYAKGVLGGLQSNLYGAMEPAKTYFRRDQKDSGLEIESFFRRSD